MSEWNRGVMVGILIAASGSATAVLMRLSIGLESVGEASITAGLFLVWALVAAIDRRRSQSSASDGVRMRWPNKADRNEATPGLRIIDGGRR